MASPDLPRPIHLWVPDLQGAGGIQHYSVCMVRAMRELFPQTRIEVLCKNDCGSEASNDRVRIRPFGHWPEKLRTAAYSSKGLWLAATQHPAFILATHPNFAPAIQYAGRLFGIPYLAAAHGIETWGHLHGRFRAALAGAAGLLPVSRFTRRILMEEGRLDPARMAVVPDTFREDAFAPGPKPAFLLERHGLRPDQPVLLTVGRLAASEAYKGHDKVIAALPAIRAVLPEVRYIIAGTGNDKARLRKCAADHGQTDAVIFAGFVPDQELAGYYRLCDAFVMPSTGEGFGIVYLEALASGKPCIVGNCDASPEAIGDGRLGFIVDPRSPAEIADAVVRLLSRQHDKPWLHDSETLRREVIRLYGFEAFKRSLDEALTKLLPQLSTINHQPATH